MIFMEQLFEPGSLSKDDVQFPSGDKATHNRKSFILCLYVKTIRSNQLKGYFAYFS